MAGLLASTPGLAAASPRVGVVVQIAVNLDADESDEIAGQLASALRDGGVDAIGGAAVRRRLPASGLPEDCTARAACLEDMGARLGAGAILSVVLVRLGAETQLDATWIDLASGAASPRDRVALPGGEAARAEALRAAFETLVPPSARPPPEVSTATIAAAPPPAPPPGAGADVGATTSSGFALPLPVWVLGGVSAVALVTAGGLGIAALGQKGGLDDDGCRESPCEAGPVDTLERTALASDVLLGIGLAAGVAAAAVWYWSPGEGGASVTAAPGPDGAWVGVGGTF